MKKLFFVALLLTVIVMSQLNAEIQYSISEPQSLNIPYPFDEIIYDSTRDTLVHFYDNASLDGTYNLYHFSMNANLQFSERTTVVSHPIGDLDFDELHLVRMDNSDSFHYYAFDDNRDVRFLTKIDNFNQVTYTLDTTTLSMEFDYYTSVCDSLLLLQKQYLSDEWVDRYSDFYIYNLNAMELILFKADCEYYEEHFKIGTEWLFRSPYNDMRYHYDNSLTFVDSLQLDETALVSDLWLYEANNGWSDSFGNGFLYAYDDGVLPMRYNHNTYFEFRPGELLIEDTGWYDSRTIKKVSENRIIGARESYEMGPLDVLGSVELDETGWHGIGPVSIDCEYRGCFSSQGHYLLFGNNGVSNKLVVYDEDLNIVHQVDPFNIANTYYPMDTYFNMLFFREYNSNSIFYSVFDVIVPNSDNVNPVLMGITTSNYPNPFNPTTTIEYSVPEKGNVRIDIYNILGQRVNSLVNSEHSKGTHTIQWDGKDSDNNTLSSGIYFYKVSQNGKSVTKKIVMMK